MAAMTGADTVIVPAQPLETWEMTTGLLERSAENRVNLLVAAQPDQAGASSGASSGTSSGTSSGASFGTSLTRDFTVMTPWEEREFDGLLSQPPVFAADSAAGITHLVIRPRWAENKVVSLGTDLLAGRPWQLLEPITTSAA